MLLPALFTKFGLYRSNLKYIYLAGLMLFFWSLFDGGFSYLVPLVVTDSGYSNTYLGFILGSSSFFGAIFDVLLSKFLPNTHYRRLYLAMFIICGIAPLFLIQNSPVVFYVIAMGLWGIYYDLSNFANVDFIRRITKSTDHADGSGIIWVFHSLGYSLAPLIIGFTVTEVLTFTPYFLLWVFLFLSFMVFLGLLAVLHKSNPHSLHTRAKRRIHLSELYLWIRIGKTLLPVLLLTMFCWIFDSFFWTIGPLINETIFSGTHLHGLFLTAYTLPPLITGFFLGKAARRIGKKRTVQLSCFLASISLCTFFLSSNSFILLFFTFLAACSMGFAFPALQAAYADYAAESPLFAKEVEALQDFFTNMGYIIGPIIAGLLSDKVGNIHSFAYLGIIGVYVVVMVSLITPKHIIVKVAS